MGEIADMMLDGTMDPETGEWNFGGEDGPGWPMTGAEAAEYAEFMGDGRLAYGPGPARNGTHRPFQQGVSRKARARRRKREAAGFKP